MSRLQSSFRWIGAQIEQKLGVCPYCMRASALGSIVGWLLFAGASLLSLNGLLQILLLGASAFTILISAHLVAYMVRVGLRLRERDRLIRSPEPATGRSLARREFLGLVLKAGAYALTLALFPSGRLFAQAGNTCADMRAGGNKGDHDVSKDDGTAAGGSSDIEEPGGANTWGNPRAAVQAAAIAKVKDKCDAICASKSCVTNPPTCLPKAPPVYTLDCFPQDPDNPPGLGWKCKAKVKQCPCKCFTCIEQAPPPPDDSAYHELPVPADPGPGMEAKADTKCVDFCNKIKCLPAPKTCKSTGKKLSDRKAGKVGGNNYVKANISKCKCACS